MGIRVRTTSDTRLHSALRRLPGELEAMIAGARGWVDKAATGGVDAAIAFGSGPGWAAALEAALLLKEPAGIPAEGVETREGGHLGDDGAPARDFGA